MQIETIKQLIEDGIPGCFVQVESDDGTHFGAIIVSEEFRDRNMVQQHQLVYKALKEELQSEAIHALALNTSTPD